jgi:hypothetical protein
LKDLAKSPMASFSVRLIGKEGLSWGVHRCVGRRVDRAGEGAVARGAADTTTDSLCGVTGDEACRCEAIPPVSST